MQLCLQHAHPPLHAQDPDPCSGRREVEDILRPPLQGTPRLTPSGVRPHQSTLTLEVLASPRQQVVEDVEGPLLLGLADGPGLLQKVFADVEEHKG